MNVIIRLQNLPWSANALDIRQFFKGLSIPDGGVHIVGGEMGDAFIAFSTDEDARQAMMHDREAINGVQVRLLLSSRAEMQKVIETARQQSLRALQNSVAPNDIIAASKAVAPSEIMPIKPQPPIITANSLNTILSSALTSAPSFLAYQQQAGICVPSGPIKNEREVRSRSRSRSRSKERSSRRRDRGNRSSERDQIVTTRRRSGRSRDRSYDQDRSRSRERSRDKTCGYSSNAIKNRRATKSSSMDANSDSINTQVSGVMSFPATALDSLDTKETSSALPFAMSGDHLVAQKSLAALNNYKLNSFLNRSNNNIGLTLQNPYTADCARTNSPDPQNASTMTSSSAIPGIFVEKKSSDQADDLPQSINDSVLGQDSIVFADTNPYEKMYPNLFAQAAITNQKPALPKTGHSVTGHSVTGSPRDDDLKLNSTDPTKTKCIKIMNMCPGTTYSDIRKFCVGLYIPHNGIKMVNDIHGLRVGVAYVQFSKYTCVARALSRNNHTLRNKAVVIEAVSENEFNSITDSFHPDNRDKSHGSRGDYSSDASDRYNATPNPFKSQQASTEPFNVLYIEDIPSLTTEQDIMKMFSSYTLYDILLIASPENRREFVAHVRFSREEDALLAFEDKAHHQIGYRRLRVRPGSIEEMERAKEKIRLANEQLLKEEQAAKDEETRLRLGETENLKNDDPKVMASLDLTQSDGEGYDELTYGDQVTDSAARLIADASKNDNCRNFGDHSNSALDSFSGASADINHLQSTKINDPRLRKAKGLNSIEPFSNTNMGNNSPMNFNGFNPYLNEPQRSPNMGNTIENNFVILKNCDYNTEINDVAHLFLNANLGLKHIEPLRNERHLPTGEFIVEFRRSQDAEIALKEFHNTQFMNRSLRVFSISPQEIADRLRKPFLGYIPGGNGIKVSDLKSLAAAMNVGNISHMASNYECSDGNGGGDFAPFNRSDKDNPQYCHNGNNNNIQNINNCNNSINSNQNFNNGLPDRFTRAGCVLELENVPYKAQLTDILNFFPGFDLKPDDIIRRFNDNGLPTGDARVVFDTPEEARRALEARRRKQIFNRTIYLNIL